METASKWTRTSTNNQPPATPGEVEAATAGISPTRLLRAAVRAFDIEFGARGRYRAAEGASDSELARLARTNDSIDDARWQNARNLYGGGRHV